MNKLEAEKNKIYLLNKSFEEYTNNYGRYKYAPYDVMLTEFYIPKPWFNCEYDFPVAVLDGNRSKYDQISLKAYDGDFYVGFFLSNSEIHDILAQKLSRELEQGKKHRMYLYAFFAKSFRHLSDPNAVPMDEFTFMNTLKTKPKKKLNKIIEQPPVLKIWGSNDGCEHEELLYESGLINNTAWKEFEIEFTPKEKYRYLIFEPYCELEDSEGSNLFLDNISNLEVIK